VFCFVADVIVKSMLEFPNFRTNPLQASIFSPVNTLSSAPRRVRMSGNTLGESTKKSSPKRTARILFSGMKRRLASLC
jgi:hypothetical protein